MYLVRSPLPIAGCALYIKCSSESYVFQKRPGPPEKTEWAKSSPDYDKEIHADKMLVLTVAL